MGGVPKKRNVAGPTGTQELQATSGLHAEKKGSTPGSARTSDPAPTVKVMGFTDSKGRNDRNLELSRERAELVREAFEQRGITGIQLKGFGSAMSVASNETADGRQRNRRVEIWVPR